MPLTTRSRDVSSSKHLGKTKQNTIKKSNVKCMDDKENENVVILRTGKPIIKGTKVKESNDSCNPQNLNLGHKGKKGLVIDADEGRKRLIGVSTRQAKGDAKVHKLTKISIKKTDKSQISSNTRSSDTLSQTKRTRSEHGSVSSNLQPENLDTSTKEKATVKVNIKADNIGISQSVLPLKRTRNLSKVNTTNATISVPSIKTNKFKIQSKSGDNKARTNIQDSPKNISYNVAGDVPLKYKSCNVVIENTEHHKFFKSKDQTSPTKKQRKPRLSRESSIYDLDVSNEPALKYKKTRGGFKLKAKKTCNLETAKARKKKFKVSVPNSTAENIPEIHNQKIIENDKKTVDAIEIEKQSLLDVVPAENMTRNILQQEAPTDQFENDIFDFNVDENPLTDNVVVHEPQNQVLQSLIISRNETTLSPMNPLKNTTYPLPSTPISTTSVANINLLQNVSVLHNLGSPITKRSPWRVDAGDSYRIPYNYPINESSQLPNYSKEIVHKSTPCEPERPSFNATEQTSQQVIVSADSRKTKQLTLSSFISCSSTNIDARPSTSTGLFHDPPQLVKKSLTPLVTKTLNSFVKRSLASASSKQNSDLNAETSSIFQPQIPASQSVSLKYKASTTVQQIKPVDTSLQNMSSDVGSMSSLCDTTYNLNVENTSVSKSTTEDKSTIDADLENCFGFDVSSEEEMEVLKPQKTFNVRDTKAIHERGSLGEIKNTLIQDKVVEVKKKEVKRGKKNHKENKENINVDRKRFTRVKRLVSPLKEKLVDINVQSGIVVEDNIEKVHSIARSTVNVTPEPKSPVVALHSVARSKVNVTPAPKSPVVALHSIARSTVNVTPAPKSPVVALHSVARSKVNVTPAPKSPVARVHSIARSKVNVTPAPKSPVAAVHSKARSKVNLTPAPKSPVAAVYSKARSTVNVTPAQTSPVVADLTENTSMTGSTPDTSKIIELFEDPEVVHYHKTHRRSYKRNAAKRYKNNIESDDELAPEVKKVVKKQKNQMTKKEEMEAERWAEQFNKMCEEIEKVPLIIEPEKRV